MRENQRTLLGQTQTSCEAVRQRLVRVGFFDHWHLTSNKRQRTASINKPKCSRIARQVQHHRTSKYAGNKGSKLDHFSPPFRNSLQITWPFIHHPEYEQRRLWRLVCKYPQQALLSLSQSTESHLVRWQPLSVSASWTATPTERRPYFHL